MSVPPEQRLPAEVIRARRPQWLALILMGRIAYERPLAFSTSTFLEVLGQLDIGPSTVRSTLQRMSERGLLAWHRRGREAYFGLTGRSTEILRRGHAAAMQPSNQPWNGTWTLLAFSIPEERRATRQRLRSRLSWAGFGFLRSGLWVAPGEVDVAQLLEDLDVMDDVQVLTAVPAAPTAADDLIREAFDLGEIADRYRRFLGRWGDQAVSGFRTQLGMQLALEAEWHGLAVADPRLPLQHLPGDWPAVPAYRLYRRRLADLEAPAQRILDHIARSIDLAAAA